MVLKLEIYKALIFLFNLNDFEFSKLKCRFNYVRKKIIQRLPKNKKNIEIEILKYFYPLNNE